MLEIKTTFKKGILIISLGGELVRETINNLDIIIDLIENNGFSNVLIETKVNYDKYGYKKLKHLKKMKNVLIIQEAIKKDINEIIKEYEPYVKSLANKFGFYKIKDDLYQAGYMGLVMAYKNFDPTYNVKFSTYAYSYILGEMKKVINETNTIKYSKELLSLKYKIEKVSILLTQKLMRNPTKEEIINFLNINENEYEEVMLMINPVSLDSKIADDLELYEVIGKKELDYSTLIALKEEIKKLNKNEKALLNSRYLYGETQKEVALELKTNQVDISRQEKKVLMKLKTKLKSQNSRIFLYEKNKKHHNTTRRKHGSKKISRNSRQI